MVQELGCSLSTAERVGYFTAGQSEVGWVIRLRGNPEGDQTRKNRRPCEGLLGFGAAKAAIASRAATVHVPTLLTPSQELAART